MSIRRKILISNIILVCVPVVLAILLWIGFLFFSGNAVINPVQNAAKNGGSLSQAQEPLYLYEAELLKVDWESIRLSGETEPDYIPGDDLAILSELSDMGYHMRVITDETVVFDNLSEDDRIVLQENTGGTQALGSLLCLGGKTIITDVFEVSNRSYAITSVYDESQADTGVFKSMLPVYMLSPAAITVFLIIIIGATVITGVLLSRWIGLSILTPLDVIGRGARQIADGNLDFKIDRPSADEFAEVCEDFEVMRKKLKESEKERDIYELKRKELLSGISHDLRSPLTSIKGYTMGLKDGIADTEDKQRRYYDAILTRTTDMERLLCGLSDLVRFENAGSHIHAESLSVDDFILGFLKEQENLLEERKVFVSYDSRLKNCRVDIDASEMQRVFTNLVENTVKYRVRSETHVRIESAVDDAYVSIQFVDDGPGVAAEALPYLFDSFYRTDEARTKPENGSGLGLAIVKGIIEGHGGRAEAFLDGGLGIRIRLPISRKDESDEENIDC